MATPAIRIENLSKLYRGKKRQLVHAVSDLDLQVGSGEVFGFLGPNGAGKSTTIKILLGLVKPTEGQAFIFDQPVSDSSARRQVGYLPENPAFYEFLTAREYLQFVGSSFGMSKNRIQEETDRVLELLQLTEAAGRPVRTYSKGMIQRLGIAQTLVHDPDLYIFDEPMSGLDPMGRALVKDIIRDLKEQGRTIFFSSHIIADVESVCDRIGVIVEGRLRTEQKVKEILLSGIKGYTISVRGAEDILKSYQHRPISGGIVEYIVPSSDFNEFTGKINLAGAVVELVEPLRSDLETFFLDVVYRNS